MNTVNIETKVEPISVEEFDKIAEEGGDVAKYFDPSLSASGNEIPPPLTEPITRG